MKIFGIGLSKTGTTSLAGALEVLGYHTRDYPGLTRYEPGKLESIDAQVLEQHEALTDTPIPSFYRELDRHYPGSKFVLTVRDMDAWLLSCKKQFTAKLAEKQNDAHNRLFIDMYGTAVFDEELFRRGYQRFVDGVLAYFAQRPADLLVLDVAAGQGWNELCAFLGKPVPELAFPKSNVTRILWMDLQELVSIAREAGQQLLRAQGGVKPSTGLSHIGALVRRSVQSLAGGRAMTPGAAAAAAQTVLARRLEHLNREIPLVSRLDHGAPMAERRRWSHFWLIDPLDGEAGFGCDGSEFTLNIALIESQKPIAGVVHAPLSGITYYAMVGKGAFKSVGDGPASRLDLQALGEAQASASSNDGPSSSKALALCRLVEQGRCAGEAIVGSMEWHSAAPDALARVIGRRLVVGATELAYNKGDWCNPGLALN
jgi:Sulfotransferase domain/Inositol monophosphatase family